MIEDPERRFQMSADLERRIQLLENSLQMVMSAYEETKDRKAAAAKMVRIVRLAQKGDDVEESRSVVRLRSRVVALEAALETATRLHRRGTDNEFMDTVKSLLGDIEAQVRLDSVPEVSDLVSHIEIATETLEGLPPGAPKADYLIALVGLQRLLIRELEGGEERLNMALNRARLQTEIARERARDKQT